MRRQVVQDGVSFAAGVRGESFLRDSDDRGDDGDDLGEVVGEFGALSTGTDGGEEGLDRVDDVFGLILDVGLRGGEERAEVRRGQEEEAGEKSVGRFLERK
jgi:hypothetical protein